VVSPTLQVVGGRGNWDPNGRPQTTEVQAVLGFPPVNQLLLLMDSADAAPGENHAYIKRK